MRRMSKKNSVYVQLTIKPGVPNANGNIYTEEVLKKAIESFKKDLPVYGPVVDGKACLKEAAFKVTDVSVDGLGMAADIEILPNREGDSLKELLRTGSALLTPYGFGSVRPDGIVEDYSLSGFSVTPIDECACGEPGTFKEEEE